MASVLISENEQEIIILCCKWPLACFKFGETGPKLSMFCEETEHWSSIIDFGVEGVTNVTKESSPCEKKVKLLRISSLNFFVKKNLMGSVHMIRKCNKWMNMDWIEKATQLQ